MTTACSPPPPVRRGTAVPGRRAPPGRSIGAQRRGCKSGGVVGFPGRLSLHSARDSSSSESVTASMARRGLLEQQPCGWAARCTATSNLLPVSGFSLSSSPFSSSSLSHGGGGGFGWGSGRPTGDWALIGGRLGFGAPKGRRGSSASVPAATRHTSGCARTVGAAAMGAGAVLAPRCTSRRSWDRR
jgi:hypothetical protein